MYPTARKLGTTDCYSKSSFTYYILYIVRFELSCFIKIGFTLFLTLCLHLNSFNSVFTHLQKKWGRKEKKYNSNPRSSYYYMHGASWCTERQIILHKTEDMPDTCTLSMKKSNTIHYSFERKHTLIELKRQIY